MDVDAAFLMLGNRTWQQQLIEENVSENQPTALSGFKSVQSGLVVF